ncbi:MAG: hypothetical protein CMJ48_09795 [Planctomycetaceae bacterium]|nr:hypothetical protein [Planctomycetaceae bacterium]
MNCTVFVIRTSVLLILAICSTVRAENDALRALRGSFRLTDGRSTGTCFVVTRKSSDSDKLRTVLVTAAHVLQGFKQDSCQLVLREKRNDGTYARKEVSVTIRKEGQPTWRKHPDLDIAVLPIDLPEGVDVAPSAFEQLADEATLKSRGIHVGQNCFIPCFPAQLEANKTGWPILRRGSIATHPLLPVSAAKTFLLDYTVFGGDSGAPVVTRPLTVKGKDAGSDGSVVVGIVIGQHRQTDKSVMPFEERIVHHSLGLAICVQAYFVRETIELLGE